MRVLSPAKVLVGAAGGLMVSVAAHACTCGMIPVDPVASAQRSSAVFLGELVSFESGEHDHVMTFRVLDALKGPVKEELVLTTSRFEASCGLPLRQIGRAYLVYAIG